MSMGMRGREGEERQDLPTVLHKSGHLAPPTDSCLAPLLPTNTHAGQAPAAHLSCTNSENRHSTFASVSPMLMTAMLTGKGTMVALYSTPAAVQGAAGALV